MVTFFYFRSWICLLLIKPLLLCLIKILDCSGFLFKLARNLLVIFNSKVALHSWLRGQFYLILWYSICLFVFFLLVMFQMFKDTTLFMRITKSLGQIIMTTWRIILIMKMRQKLKAQQFDRKMFSLHSPLSHLSEIHHFMNFYKIPCTCLTLIINVTLPSHWAFGIST